MYIIYCTGRDLRVHFNWETKSGWPVCAPSLNSSPPFFMPAPKGNLWDHFLDSGEYYGNNKSSNCVQRAIPSSLLFTSDVQPAMATGSAPIHSDLNRGREPNQVLNQFKLCNHSEPGLELPQMHCCPYASHCLFIPLLSLLIHFYSVSLPPPAAAPRTATDHHQSIRARWRAPYCFIVVLCPFVIVPRHLISIFTPLHSLLIPSLLPLGIHTCYKKQHILCI